MPATKLYKERKAKGLCVDCGCDNLEDGFVRCLPCREAKRKKHNELARNKRNRRIENHQCVDCGCDLKKDWFFNHCPKCKEKRRIDSSERQRRKIKNHICIGCGCKMEDRWKHTYCPECKEKHNKETRESRKFYISMGICPYCKKEKLFGDEVICLSCAEKNYISKRKNYKETTQEERDKRNLKRRELRKERIAQGICVSCGSKSAEDGKKYCKRCLIKNAENKMKYFVPKETNALEERKKDGKCLWCEKPVLEDKCFCKDCYARICEHLALQREKHDTGKYNRKFFYRKKAR